MANATVQRLGEVDVLLPSGESTRLGAFWDTRPVLLAIIRHFG